MKAARLAAACFAFAASTSFASSTMAVPAQSSAGAIFVQLPNPGGPGMDDASVTKRVEDKLADAAPGAEHVTVYTRNRIVTLSGRVESDGMRDRVGALATATQGVAAVNNQVVVVPKYPPAQKR